MATPAIQVLVTDTIHEQGVANLHAKLGFHVGTSNGTAEAELIEKLGANALIVQK